MSSPLIWLLWDLGLKFVNHSGVGCSVGEDDLR